MAAKRILVFESDTEFAGQLTRDFARFGGVVEVVDDGNVGLERARVERPDLILLCIELPRMNGFSICNKLKKNPELKDIPLVIMSSEATEETFEQHRKLRTRAEDYLRKPFSFETLLEKVTIFVQLEPGDAMPADEPVIFDEEIALDEAIQFDEETMLASTSTAKGLASGESEVRVDDEVEAFAEEAFGNLLMGGEADRTVSDSRPSKKQRKSSAQVPVAETRSVAATPPPSAAGNGSSDELHEAAHRNQELQAELDRVNAEVRRLAEELALSQSEAATARSDVTAAQAAVATAKAEAAAAQTAAAKGGKGGTVSSREFLDLRETINKKDKEILDLRDSINSRDKQIIEVRDKVNALEREKADLEDKQIEFEKTLGDRAEEVEGLAADKEAAIKRGDDLKHRLERAQGEIEKGYRELDEEKKLRDEAVAGKDVEIEGLKVEHQKSMDELQRVRDEQQSRAVSSLDASLRKEMADALARQKSEADGLAESIAKAHAKALKDAEERRQSELFEADEKRKTELRLAEDEHRQQMQQTNESHAQAMQSAQDAANAQRERELNAQIERHGREMAVLGGKLAESEDKLQHRTEELAELRAEKEKGEARDAEKIATLTKRGDDLEGDRDGLRVELSTARTEIEVLHGRVRDLSGKLQETEDKNVSNEERALRALAKIRADEQTVDKAKRAMAIALSLLDEQIQPRLEDQ